MDINDNEIKKYEIVKEMFQTAGIVRNFDLVSADNFCRNFSEAKKIFFTGEGSSRIFPSKRAISWALKKGTGLSLFSEGATQAIEYDLTDFTVLASSNSGKTKEVALLLSKLGREKHMSVYSVIANGKTILERLATGAFVLSCGIEKTVAATKSVVEQALVMDVCMRIINGSPMPDLTALSEKITEILSLVIDERILEIFASSDVIYFSGRNDGVAEELVLKTSEIVRKKSVYLEGTYAVHGIEEVMRKNETVVIIEPFEEEEEKFGKCLVEGVGMNVIAVSSRQTSFPTIVIPAMDEFNEYLQLVAGWNLLLSTALKMNINPDKPIRARKIGNEYE